MTDAPPYTTDVASNDVYFNCADIVLSASAPDAGTTDAPPTGPDAGTNPQSPGSVDGGCATTSGASGLVMLGIVGALVRRRRRS
ncbi:MAG: MYXO-CTERM sorting domain-containing protein, partial [Proteobacteria bacterium]|nr:MYXO-CTERM sorting domain-containing protein [Pseudomonadota bacterium]